MEGEEEELLILLQKAEEMKNKIKKRQINQNNDLIKSHLIDFYLEAIQENRRNKMMLEKELAKSNQIESNECLHKMEQWICGGLNDRYGIRCKICGSKYDERDVKSIHFYKILMISDSLEKASIAHLIDLQSTHKSTCHFADAIDSFMDNHSGKYIKRRCCSP
jgi:hypothetical protein